MKTLQIMVILFLTLVSQEIIAQAPVQDKNSRRQSERMVFQRWNQFRPKWYFRLFHNRYRKGPDRRNMIQLSPTMLFLNENSRRIAEEQAEIDEWEKYKLAQQANIVAETHYHTYFNSHLNKVKSRYTKYYQQCLELEVDPGTLQELNSESAMLDEYLEIVRKGNTNPGESREAMTEILDDWNKLASMTYTIANNNRIKRKVDAKGILKE